MFSFILCLVSDILLTGGEEAFLSTLAQFKKDREQGLTETEPGKSNIWFR